MDSIIEDIEKDSIIPGCPDNPCYKLQTGVCRELHSVEDIMKMSETHWKYDRYILEDTLKVQKKRRANAEIKRLSLIRDKIRLLHPEPGNSKLSDEIRNDAYDTLQNKFLIMLDNIFKDIYPNIVQDIIINIAQYCKLLPKTPHFLTNNVLNQYERSTWLEKLLAERKAPSDELSQLQLGYIQEYIKVLRDQGIRIMNIIKDLQNKKEVVPYDDSNKLRPSKCHTCEKLGMQRVKIDMEKLHTPCIAITKEGDMCPITYYHFDKGYIMHDTANCKMGFSKTHDSAKCQQGLYVTLTASMSTPKIANSCTNMCPNYYDPIFYEGCQYCINAYVYNLKLIDKKYIIIHVSTNTFLLCPYNNSRFVSDKKYDEKDSVVFDNFIMFDRDRFVEGIAHSEIAKHSREYMESRHCNTLLINKFCDKILKMCCMVCKTVTNSLFYNKSPEILVCSSPNCSQKLGITIKNVGGDVIDVCKCFEVNGDEMTVYRLFK